MEPAEVEVTESEADVMGPEGVGWGLVLEEPPPGELDDTGDPQPGRSEEAVRASAPWMVCRRVREKNLWRRGAKGIIFSTLFPALKKDSALDSSYSRTARRVLLKRERNHQVLPILCRCGQVTNGLPRRRGVKHKVEWQVVGRGFCARDCSTWNNSAREQGLGVG